MEENRNDIPKEETEMENSEPVKEEADTSAAGSAECGENEETPCSEDAPEDKKEEAEAEETEEQKTEEAAADEDASAEKDKTENSKAGGEKKGFFGRNKKKDKRDVQIEELTDRVKRQMAEFDNFRKRTEKEKAAMFEVGARSVLEKILPVVDNFERGLAAADENPDDPYVEGMQKIYKQLMGVLEGLDVRPIDAKGKEFDPNLHNAVMHVDDESFGENIVADELQKGYTYRGTVLRHSMVKVAN